MTRSTPTAPPVPHLATPVRSERLTRPPRFGRREGALWLGLGLCLATLLLMHGKETPR